MMLSSLLVKVSIIQVAFLPLPTDPFLAFFKPVFGFLYCFFPVLTRDFTSEGRVKQERWSIRFFEDDSSVGVCMHLAVGGVGELS